MGRQRTLFSYGVIAIVGVLSVCWVVLLNVARDGSNLEAISRNSRLADRIARYQSSFLVRRISQWTGVDPVQYFTEKAEKKAAALCKSGDAVIFTAFMPNQLAREPEMRDRLSTNVHGMARIRGRVPGLFLSNLGLVQGYVLPADVAYWQSEFCGITDRVGWGELRKFSGSDDSAEYLLPDGQFVDLNSCQKWLNESIAEGWAVGVTSVLAKGNMSFYASRKKGSSNVQQAERPNVGPHHQSVYPNR